MKITFATGNINCAETMRRILVKIIPGIKWLDGYTVQYGIADFIAGITVGLTVLPQGLAYATLAGLEPQYGLYSAFMGGLVYALLGGCREVTIGPTALLALMTSRHTGLGLKSGPQYAILLCFLSGIVELIMALLRLGTLVDFISLPVTVGFTSATAVIIGTSQIKGLLGLKGGSGSEFIETIKSVVQNIHKTRVGDLSLGLTSIVILLLLRKLKDVKLRGTSRFHRFASISFWVIATARNALIVLIASLIAFYAEEAGKDPFILTGTVKSGLPKFAVPSFETKIESTNGTVVEQNFIDMVSELGPSIILVPIIAVLGNVAISKAFGGAGINPTRELVALSLSNICGSFFSSQPVTGSFSRSAVNHATGVKTPIGGIYTSCLVLLALGVLTPYFKYIPKAALSAVIISAVVFMIEYEVVKPLWRCNKRELLPGAITFILSLCFGVEIGLLVGVASDLAFLVYRAARPVLSVEKQTTDSGVEYTLIHPKHSFLFFPATEWVCSGVAKAVRKNGSVPVVLDCRHLNEFDFTAAKGLGMLHKELSTMKVPFILLGPTQDAKKILQEAANNSVQTIGTLEEIEVLLQQVFEAPKQEVVSVDMKGN